MSASQSRPKCNIGWLGAHSEKERPVCLAYFTVSPLKSLRFETFSSVGNIQILTPFSIRMKRKLNNLIVFHIFFFFLFFLTTIKTYAEIMRFSSFIYFNQRHRSSVNFSLIDKSSNIIKCQSIGVSHVSIPSVNIKNIYNWVFSTMTFLQKKKKDKERKSIVYHVFSIIKKNSSSHAMFYRE